VFYWLTKHKGEVGVLPALEGIGYYEQIPLTGVNGVSLAGGGEIVIYGQGMSHTPSLITALFSNPNMGGTFTGGAPKACKYPFKQLSAIYFQLESKNKFRGYRFQLAHRWWQIQIHAALAHADPLDVFVTVRLLGVVQL
jgi:hypothetical protein